MKHKSIGYSAALAAFVFWGVAPLYFKLLVQVPALEIIAHRVIWAVPTLLLFLLLRDGRSLFQRLRVSSKTLLALLASGLLVAANWLVFVWAVTHDQVLATSLGYFINPLVNILLGLMFLQERLNRVQWVAVMIAASGTLYLGWYLGQAPWIALFLAFSFGFYGLLKKRIPVGPMLGLFWETSLLSGAALVYLLWLITQGNSTFNNISPGTDLLLVLSGLVTVLPLIWFNAAAQRLPLSVIGFFQYIAPTISFFLAVWLFNEPFTWGHKVAFAGIWCALLLISLDSLRRQPTPNG